MGIKTQKILISTILSIFLISLVSAFNGYYGGSWGSGWDNFYLGDFSPSTLLENEWVIFLAFFILTFALVYLALFRAFSKKVGNYPQDITYYLFPPKEAGHSNQGPIVVISLVIALLVSSAITRRAFLYGFIGEEIGSWLVFLLFLVVMIGLIWAVLKIPNGLVRAVGALIVWMIYTSLGGEILPYNLPDRVGWILSVLASGFAGVILVLIVIVIGFLTARKTAVGRWASNRARGRTLLGG